MKKVPVEVTKVFKFDSAHNLERYRGRCEALHGHTYTLEVTVKGLPGEDDMVMDFAELKQIVKTNVIDRIDHTYLNAQLGINPTSENLALWIWDALAPIIQRHGAKLYAVTLWETPENRVRLTAADME